MTETSSALSSGVERIGGLLSNGRQILTTLAFVGLVASNITTVVNNEFHDAVHGVVSAVALVAGEAHAQRLLTASSNVRRTKAVEIATKEASVKAAAQEVMNRELQTKYAALDQQLKTAQAKSAANAKVTKGMATRVKGRLVAAVSRSTASLAGKSLPAIGIAVSIGMTAYEVHDACETLKDINGVLAVLNQAPEDQSICGEKVPSYKSVLESVRTNWKDSIEFAKREVGGLKGQPNLPEIKIPQSLSEVMDRSKDLLATLL